VERYDATQLIANKMRRVEKPKKYLQHIQQLEGCVSRYHKKNINTPCELSAEIINIRVDGTCCHERTLKG